MSDRRWVLWRQDDNGNRDVVATFATKAAAEAACEAYEARGHKQTYRVERRS